MKVQGLRGEYELMDPAWFAEKNVTAPCSANNTQIGGNHYKDKKIQPWDAIVAWDCGFLDGNVIKYVARYRSKGGIEDLKKARHYLDKLIEVETENTANGQTNTEKA